MYNSSTKSVKQLLPKHHPKPYIPVIEPLQSPNVIGIAIANKVVGTGASQSGLSYSSVCDVYSKNCNKEYRIIYQDKLDSVVSGGSKMTILSSGLINPEIEFAINDMYYAFDIHVILQARYPSNKQWFNVNIPPLTFPRGVNKATIKFSGNTSDFGFDPYTYIPSNPHSPGFQLLHPPA